MKKHVLGIVIAIFLYMALLLPSLADRIVLPSGTTVVEDEAFYCDQSLTELILPEGLLRIGSKAFASTALNSVVLPQSLQYFARDAFDFSNADFEFYIYEGSDIAQLCEEYELQPKIIGGNKVGISLPTKDLKRWNQEGVYLKSILEGYGYEVELQYASNDVPTQLAQIETMIDNGAKVVVIAAIESSSLGQALDKAAENGVKVLAYDRLLMDNENVDYFVTFDNYKVGFMQGAYIKDALELDNADGPFYMEITAGDPGDSKANFFHIGAMDVLKPYIDAGKIIVKSGQIDFASVATPGWKTEVAQRRAENILPAIYLDDCDIDAWLCSNDSTARGVIYALEANYTGTWPIITGQDCDIQNVRNIITGKQAMSVFKDTRTLAAQAAKMVRQIMGGESVDVNDTELYNNNKKIVPAYLCDPVFCDANNYKELLIDSGFYTEDDIGAVSPRPTLAEADIQMSENVPVGKNCSFSFSPVENATSYTATFKAGTNEIISWGSVSALPNTNLTIPGYWLDNGNYSITVTASANGYRDSTSTLTFKAAGDERPAPTVEVDHTNVFIGGTCTFTVNTENSNDLRYCIGNNYYTNHINVLDEETKYTASFYSAGDYEYRFTVRKGNTWSEWSEPIVIHVAEETILAAPVISILSTLEEGRDLIVSLSEVTGATRYGINIYSDDGSIYSNYSLLSDEISSIEIPGYNISAGSYTISASSNNGSNYSNTTYKSITILDADKPDAPAVEPPTNTTVASNSSVTFKIDTTGADKIAVRYFIPGNSQNASYETKTVDSGQNETNWSFLVNGNSSWKYAFSVRKGGIWSFWSSPITISVEKTRPVTLIYAEVNPIEGTIAGEMAKAFKEKVEELSDGSVVIDIQDAGRLGSQGDYLDDMLGINTIDICCVSVSTLVQYGTQTKANLLTLPYVFENREHFWNFANSNLAKTFLNEPQTQNLPIRGLAYGEEGFRYFFFRNSVVDISSLRGLKIRVPSSPPVMSGLVSSLGARPTIVAFSELYISLQSAIVDGSEQSLMNYKVNSFFEVAPYILMDEHTVSAIEMIISDNAWNQLTEEEQGWVQEAANYASNRCREASEAAEAQILQYLETQDVTIIEVRDKTPWQEAVQEVITDNLNGEGAAYQSILALK